MKKGELGKKILKGLFTAGAITFALSSPYFILNILKGINYNKYEKKRVAKTFYYLHRRGLINYRRKGKQIYISLTKRGKLYAQELQIDDLEIKRPKRWDKKWRILMFDIPYINRLVREALRGKLKELGFIQLQKSVWLYPFDCEKEFKILKTFFSLPGESFMLVVATKIPFEEEFKRKFGI
ncbi:MAG: hypothetical protein AB1465_03995 [Patescibacteria group bacterium]